MSARTRLTLWIVLMSLTGIWLWWVVGARLHVETDITAMLPQTAPDAVTQQALARVDTALGQHGLYLVGAPDFASARRAADVFADTLRTSPAYTNVSLEQASDPAGLDAAYGPARLLLLSNRDRARLQQHGAQGLADAAQRALYSPADLMRPRSFAADPLELYGHYLLQLLPAGGKLTPRDGVLTLERSDGIDILVSATLRDPPFQLSVQDPSLPALEAATRDARASGHDVTIAGSGGLRHAAAASADAKHEISTIGSISLVGVLLIFLVCFRSLRPLLLMLLSLGAASLVSLATVATIYGTVHLIALVFELSLVGLAVNYSIHFFSDRFRDPKPWTGMDGLHHVGMPITVGVGTTLLAYCAFLIPPFPGLRQMALLSMTGLFASYLTVILVYPALAGTPPPATKPVLWLRDQLARLSQPPPLVLASLIVAGSALLVIGGMRLHFVDDIGIRQSSPHRLLTEESTVRQRLGGGIDTRFFIVEGDKVEDLLQHEERLRARLDPLVARHLLGDYSALSRWVPSHARQQQDAELLANTVYADNSPLAQLYATLGFPAATFAQAQADFASARTHAIELDALLTSAAATMQPLWLGKTARGVASVVTLTGVVDAGALSSAAAGLPAVRLIDRAADLSHVLGHYRQLAMFGLGGALLVIAFVLGLRYGATGSTRHLIAPIGGCLLTLATLGAFGIPANLFTVLALLLVLGLGVDYSVFVHEDNTSRPTILLAITLAGLVTLLTFGLLAGSSTPFIRSLGLGVLLGVAYTWLLTVLTAAPARQMSTDVQQSA